MQNRSDLYLERMPNGSIVARGGSQDGKVFGSSTRSITSPRNERYALRAEAVVYTTSGEKIPVVMLKPSQDEQQTYDSNDVRESYAASQSPASLLEASKVIDVSDAAIGAGIKNVSEGEQVFGLTADLTDDSLEVVESVALGSHDIAADDDNVVVGVASDTVVSDTLLKESKPVVKKPKTPAKGRKG